MESQQEPTQQTSPFRNKFPYYVLPAFKKGVITGAIICVINGNLKGILNVIIPKSSLLNDINTNSYYDNIRSLIQTLFPACILIFGIFYGIRKAKKITANTENFPYLRAFITGCIVTLVIYSVLEFNTIFNLVTYVSTPSFSRKEAIMRNLNSTFLPGLLTGFVCSLILSIFLKSKKKKEIDIKQ
jgi:hypothetical protein